MSALTQETIEETAAVEAGLGVLCIMGPSGDVRITWDPNIPSEVEAARRAWDDATAKGMRGYSVKKNGKPDALITTFPNEAGKVILAAALVGG